MNNPLVSAIITTYNRKDYLIYALESVLNQTYDNFELIIVDDGSTDGTSEIVNDYNDNRIRYYYQENAGQNPARNKGMELAQGEYIGHLDSDDIWVPEKLEKQVEILNKFPDIGLVYCGTLLINGDNQVTGKQPLIIHSGNILDKLLMTNFLYNGSCALFRKECLSKVGCFDETIKRMTDWEFYLKFAMYYQFFGQDDYLLKYRVHNETMSKDYKSYETYGIRILENIFNHADFDKSYLKYKNRAYALRYAYMGRRYLENNDTIEAKRYFNMALKHDSSLIFHKNCLPYVLLSHLPIGFIDMLRTIKKQ